MKWRYLLLGAAAVAFAAVGLITLVPRSSDEVRVTSDKRSPNSSPVPGPSSQPTRPPDSDRGAVIAAQGTAAGATACAQCHAFNGVSDASGAFPRIAGQSPEYLAKQLRAFASGVRSNALMSPIAKALTGDDVGDVAGYYAGADGPVLPLKAPDPAPVQLGERLATVGSAQRRIQNCNNCHGPSGVGEPPAIPYLAGQYANYIRFTLREWQRGLRDSSPNQMAVVAHKLDEQEIAAVAAYYQQVLSAPGGVKEQPKQ